MALEGVAKNSVCSGCGVAFDCGAIAGLQTCWCMEKPSRLLAVEPGSSGYADLSDLGRQDDVLWGALRASERSH